MVPEAGAVSEFQLRQHALQLLIGNLLLQAGDLGLRIQFAQAAGKGGDLNIVLVLGLLGFDFGAQGLGRRNLGFGAKREVEEGNRDLEAEADVVGREVLVIGAVAVQLVGVVVVDSSEADLRTAPCQVVAAGFNLLGARERRGGFNAGESSRRSDPL